MPIDINVQFNKEQVPSLEKEIVEIWKRYVPYKVAVGCIMYTMIDIRPDIVITI